MLRPLSKPITVLLIAVLFAPAQASAVDCAKAFRSLANKIFGTAPAKAGGAVIDARWKIKSDLTELHPVVQKWIEKRQGEIKIPSVYRHYTTGARVDVGGVPCEVVAVLGHGVQGAVYLVKTPQGLRTLKNFGLKSELKDSMRELAAFYGIRKPALIKADEENRNVLLEYLDGVPLLHLEHASRTLGVPQAEVDEIFRQWELIQEKAGFPLREYEPGPKTDNVGYSFERKEFYLIDPN